MSTTSLALPATADADRVVAAFFANRSEHTLRAYQSDLHDFSTFVNRARGITLASTADAMRLLVAGGPGAANLLVLDYRTDLAARGLSPVTSNRRLAALRSLLHLARTLGLIDWRLSVDDLRAKRQRDTRGPGEKGLDAMLAALKDDLEGVRDRALLHLLYDLALRRGEVVGLDVGHLEMSRVSVLGKGRDEREWLELPESTAQAVLAWLRVHPCRPLAAATPVFVSLGGPTRGKRLSAGGLYWIVTDLGTRAGIGHVRPHGLRHAGITSAMAATGRDVVRVQKYARHASIKTTLLYDDSQDQYQGEVARLVAGRKPPAGTP